MHMYYVNNEIFSFTYNTQIYIYIYISLNAPNTQFEYSNERSFYVSNHNGKTIRPNLETVGTTVIYAR